MLLCELLDYAYTSDYLPYAGGADLTLDGCLEIKQFAKTWKHFLTMDINDFDLVPKVKYGRSFDGSKIRNYNTTYVGLLNDEYKYLIE